MAEANSPPEHIIRARHELRDLSPKHIALFGAALALTIVLALWLSSVLMRHYYNVEEKSQPPRSPLSFNQPPMPEPRLIVVPGQDLLTLRKQEEDALRSYAWVDKEKGIARIPIERAMEILAQKNMAAAKEKTVKTKLRQPSEEKETQNGTQAAEKVPKQ